MGPWAHGAWNGRNAERLGDFDFGSEASGRYYHYNFELPFFEYYLRGEGSLESLPQVSLFLSGSNEWYTTDSWQLAETEVLSYYLDGESLTTTAPAVDVYRSYTSDPDNPVPYDSVTDYRRREYMLSLIHI